MSVEAAFANYAPEGGSLCLAAAGNGPSVNVEAAYADAMRGMYAGSSLGVEAAFASAAPQGVDPCFGGSPVGFDGSSLLVEAAFANPGPRRASGASCAVGAGGSSVVAEGEFADVAPPDEAGASTPTGAPSQPMTPQRQQPSALAAMYAAAEARQMAVNTGHSFHEDSSVRAPSVGTPRQVHPSRPMGPAPQRWPTTVLGAPPTPVQLRPGHRMELMESSALVQPAQPFFPCRQGGTSFRSAVYPPATGFALTPMRQDPCAAYEVPLARPIGASSEVLAYPYMYQAPDLRHQALASAQAVPAQPVVQPQRLSFDNSQSYSYTGVPTSGGGLYPSFVPAPTSYQPRPIESSRQEQVAASASATPTKGLSLMPMAPAPGVAYPGPAPVRGQTVQFSTAYPSPMPVQVDVRAATTSSVLAAPALNGQVAPQRGVQQPNQSHFANASTAVYAQAVQGMQPFPGFAGGTPGVSLNLFNQQPQAPDGRPSASPAQVPSYIAPLAPGQSYTLPQAQVLQGMPQVLQGMSLPAGLGSGMAVSCAPQCSGLRPLPAWMQLPQARS